MYAIGSNVQATILDVIYIMFDELFSKSFIVWLLSLLLLLLLLLYVYVAHHKATEM